MHRFSFFPLSLLLFTAIGYCQTPSTESQALQDLVGEIRQLRQDLRALERAQILIGRLQIQQAVVGRVLQRLDDARSKFAAMQAMRRNLATRIKNSQDSQNDPKGTAQQQKETEDLLKQLNAQLELAMSEESERQTTMTECEEQVRVEQARLSAFQEQLDQFDGALKDPVRR